MSENDSRLSRRAFIKAASVAGVAAGCSPKPGPQKLIPYLVPPEDMIPGKPLFYRTVCRECPAGCGVTARVRDGRVIKLEGNPEDPISRGALCARGQAAVQRLYAPDRLKGPMKRNAHGGFDPITWDDAQKILVANIVSTHDRGFTGAIHMLSRPEPGSVGALHRAFMQSLGAGPDQRMVLEPFDATALREAGADVFGREEIPDFDLSAARSVVSFGADFLETWLSPVALTRGFAGGRGKIGPERTRLTWVGPRLSATGASADRWLRSKAGGETAVALGLLRWLVDPANQVSGLAPEAASIFKVVGSFTPDSVEKQSGVSGAELVRVAAELAARRPSAVLGPGISSSGPDAAELARAILLVNYVLGNTASTVRYGLDPMEDPGASFADIKAFLETMEKGGVEILLLHHADPVGALPAAMRAQAALAKVPLLVSFSDRIDATTRQAHLILPDNHPLESFGDVSPRKGVVSLCQPTMTPVADTRASSQVLLDVATALPFGAAHFPFHDFYEYTQTYGEMYAMLEVGAIGDLVAHQRAALQRGGYYSDAKAEAVALRPEAVRPFGAPAPSAEGLALHAFPTTLRYDGRAGDLPWLREVPDTMSTVSWRPWVELSPAMAAHLSASNGDVLELSTSAGKVELPLSIYPPMRDDVVAIPHGGPEGLSLLPVTIDPKTGALAWQGATVIVRNTGQTVTLPRAEARPPARAGELLKKVSAKDPALAPAPNPEQMYPPLQHAGRRWAMAIDLDRCNGCQACVVACYAENNVPVNGPDLEAEGRNMAWLRIERYFDFGAKTSVDFLPMLCQQCDNAPCEPVCPVYATYHNNEGLNAQVYNRCVGTRYCANNCPYKVRSFNYRDPQFPTPLNMQLNPDVTVRERGVMEKCTFCVQRIRYAENAAKSDGRPVADGEVAPACVQTCPAQAFVFGDANDAKSRIAAVQKDRRGFRAMEEINTRPAITYLAHVEEEDES